MRSILRTLLLTAAVTAPASATSSTSVIITVPGPLGFTARGEINPYGSRAQEIHPADLDGDGDTDLVVQARQSPTVQIFENTGHGRFTMGTLWEEGDNVQLRAVADFDDDGLPDLLVSERNVFPNPTRILYGSGSGLVGFGPRETALGSLPMGNYPQVHDVNGNGKADLILSDRTILDPGTGAPFNVVMTDNSELTSRHPNLLRWADWSGDGLPDFFYKSHSQLRYYINLGGGHFGAAQTRDLPAEMGDGPILEDLQVIEDERLPGTHIAIIAVITDEATNTQRLCLLQESGPEDTAALFSTPFGGGDDESGKWFTAFTQAPGQPLLAATGEIKIGPDFTITQNRGEVSEITLAFKKGESRLIAKTRVKTERIPDLIQQADLNGDGNADLLVASVRDGDTAGGDLSYHRGNRKGAFAAKQVAITSPATDDTATHLTDMDGDGDQDIIVHGHSPVDNEEEIALLVNDGHANFRRRVILGGLRYAEIVSIADRNGDGRPDLVVSSYGWRKNGDGERSVVLSLSTQGKARKTLTLFREAAEARLDQVQVGDWDKDGRDDLLLWETVDVPGVLAHPVRWLKGAAGNLFGAPQDLGYGFYETLQDMDGDGDLDLVPSRKGLYRGYPPQNSWRENIGASSLPLNHVFVVGGVPAGSYAIVAAEADLGGDAKADLFSFFTDGDTDVSRPVIVGAGGALTAQVAFPPGEPWFDDIDGDGDTDVLLVTEPSRNLGRRGLALLRNNGGTFAAPLEISELSYADWKPALAADLDGDGKKDVVASDIQQRPRIEWFKNQ